MTNNLEDDIKAIVAGMDNQENRDNAEPPQQEIQDVYLLIVREHEEVTEDQSKVVESSPEPVTAQQDSFLSAYIFVCFSLFLILATLTFQLYSLFNPPIATIIIIPKSQQVILNGTLQLGRLLQPITISQSATTTTTGHGHHDARSATGYVTFYNGQFQPVTIAAGTILQGSSGIQIVTDQDVTIPAGNPPSYGQATVSAHAVSPGSKGNIPSFDINQIYANAVLVKNTNSFSGGQDERNFQTVAKADITNAATPLQATLKQSVQGALQATAKNEETIFPLPCTPIVMPNQSVGDEAIQVKVVVSLTCSAIAYDTKLLENMARALLTTQALSTLAGYSQFGEIHVSVKQATMSRIPPHLVFLSFQAYGTWIYGLAYYSQQQIKSLMAGKSKAAALHLLLALPGIQQVSIAWGDDSKLPKNVNNIHIQIIMQKA